MKYLLSLLMCRLVMHGNRFSIPLLLVVISFSCETKEVSSLTFPSVYHKAGISAVGSLRVFAATGEISSNSVINRFSRYDTSYFSSFSKFLRSDPKIMDSVSFSDSQCATLYHDNRNIDCLIARENNLFTLTESYASSNCCTKGEVFTRSLPFHMVSIKPQVHSEFIYTSTGGTYHFGYQGQRKFVMKESHGQLVAPLILYTLHAGKFDSGFVYNELQPNFYSTLAAGDTVALMEYMIYFEK